MNQKQQKIPKLRFPEFEGEWHKEKLKNHIDLFTGYSFKGEDITENTKGTPLLRGINITEGRIRHNENYDRYYIGNIEALSQYLVKEGDMVLSMDGSKVGKNVALIDASNSNSLLVQRVARIRAKSNSDINFLYQIIFSIKFQRYVDTVNTSSGIPHISSKQINDFIIGIPNLKEQQKIASFLTSVDKRIQALEQKKELLEQYKKGVMQKIFSREIRFQPGTITHNLPLAAEPKTAYNNNNAYPDWEVKKLGDIATITTGSSNREDSSLVGEYTFFDRSQDIRTSDRYLFDKEAIIFPGEGQKFVPKYFIGKFDLHQRAYAIFDFKGTDGLYLYYLLSFSDRHLQAQAVGSTVKSLRLPMFKSMPINLPCLEEQQKIAGFLNAIDTKIEAVTSQIDHSKTFKKGLLQKMFV